MSSALFDYIQVVKPSLGDEKRATIGHILIHYITLLRVSGGQVRIDNVLTTSGRSFVNKVARHMPLVRSLGFALKVDMSYVHDDSPVPTGLRRLCDKYHIDVEACIRRNKKLEKARNELWDLVIFVRVALAVMAALHEDTLCTLDRSYCGHRPAGFKPKRKWLGLATAASELPMRACDLPRAKAPRAVGASIIPTSIGPGPVAMSRKTSDESTGTSSSASSGSKSAAHKRRASHRPLAY